MARVLIRAHPMPVYYLTGPDAVAARRGSTGGEDTSDRPVFTTDTFGEGDGLTWETAEEFEREYREMFPEGGLGGGEPEPKTPTTRKGA